MPGNRHSLVADQQVLTGLVALDQPTSQEEVTPDHVLARETQTGNLAMPDWMKQIRRRPHSGKNFLATWRVVQPVAPELRARELRLALESLGPYYRNLGLYLSSRIDLLPAHYCREFAQIEDTATPLHETEAKELLLRELGPARMAAFAHIDYASPQPALTTQSQPAQLSNGTPVSILLLRPEYYELPQLRRSNPYFEADKLKKNCTELVLHEALNDFLAYMELRTNLREQAIAIDALSQSAKSCSWLGAPMVYTELCTPRVMVFKQVEALSLSAFFEMHPYSAPMLSARICSVWFHLAVTAKAFPLDFQPQNIFVSEKGLLYFQDCAFASLPRRTQENLQSYMTATAASLPDEAAVHLLKEMSRTSQRALDVEQFRGNFRQAAPFGLLEPVLGANSNALPQLIFQQWKTALDHGYRTEPHLLSFYRGLFAAARTARATSPLRDSLREGWEDFRAARTIQEFWELSHWSSWTQDLDKYATAIASLPSALDHALTLASIPEQASTSLEQTASGVRARKELREVPAVLFVLAIAVLLSQVARLSVWTTRLTVLALVLAGLMLLRSR